jgi:hypothetical protein
MFYFLLPSTLILFIYLFLVVLRFEFMASHLLGKCFYCLSHSTSLFIFSSDEIYSFECSPGCVYLPLLFGLGGFYLKAFPYSQTDSLGQHWLNHKMTIPAGSQRQENVFNFGFQSSKLR